MAFCWKSWRCKWVWMMSILLLLALSFAVCEGCLKVERETLLKIKDDINYPNGSSLSSWKGHHCCQWDGITCDYSKGRVIQIDLYGVRQKKLGTWYPNASVFAQLEELSYLNLGDNHVGGWSMPQGLRELTRLQSLDLGQNVLENDHFYLHGLTMLKSLHLRNNRLQRNFITTSGLCKLVALEYLDLSGNNFDDRNLPMCFGNLTKLDWLDLSRNKLSGNLLNSTGLCELRALSFLSLSSNALESIIPSCIGNMDSLITLKLSSNLLSGSIPPSVSNLRSLQQLDLSNNYLNGSILWLGNLSSLVDINLEYNNFDGVLEFSTLANLSYLDEVRFSNNPLWQLETESPTWIPSFQLSIIDLSNCQLNTRNGGSIPSFLTIQTKLNDIDLSRNNLRGYIPSWLLFNWTSEIELKLKLNDNLFTAPLPLPSTENTTRVAYFDISENNIEGLLPSMLLLQLSYLNMSGNALQGITTFQSDNYEASQLRVLDLSRNDFSRELPMELFANGAGLEYLSLSNNNLHFDTTPSLSNMTWLEVLLLDKNAFSETKIFQGLANISSLQVLDIRDNLFTGIVPNWLSTISNLTSLLLGGNKFFGHIPDELCQMQELRLLDFSYNELSGNIPPCFIQISAWINGNTTRRTLPRSSSYGHLSPQGDYNLRTTFTTKGRELTYEGTPLLLMIGIDFSSNKLTGKIPLEIGNLKGIRSLNLSHNLLTGEIPKTFQYLQNIESLDLSNNKLTGHIPMELTQLYSLSSFNVAFNNLSGMIPYSSKGQFSTFDESIYEGNPSLCGQPLKRNCSSNSSTKPPLAQSEENDESMLADNPLFFYSCVAISYALGFWGFIALLYISKSWRMKLFSVVDHFFKV